jgi:sugar transferase (PEP-CTERM system associated)
MKIRVFKHYIPLPLVALAALEFCVLVVAIGAGIGIRYGIEGAALISELAVYTPEITTFATVHMLAMIAVGVYHMDHYRNLRVVTIRLAVSIVSGFLVLAMIYYIVPPLEIWRSAFVIGSLLAFVGILTVRSVFLQVTGLRTFGRRIAVLGAGRWAKRIEDLVRDEKKATFKCVGFIPMNGRAPEIDQSRIVTGVNSLAAFARDKHVEEIIVAVEERRGGLPVQDLLTCKLNGVRVIDFSSFWERETGRVDLDALNPSWLIFSDGFAANRSQRVVKRMFDVMASLLLLMFSLPILVITTILIKLDSRGPVFYRQKRVGLNGETFELMKFRSMTVDAERDGTPRWAEVNDPRVTRVGSIIRTTRIDELPQIFNVLKGDMSFIGPRPERPFFVEELAANIPYYSARHGVKPGISGWAQLNYPYGASMEDAREKLQYDLYYIKNYSVFLDLTVMIQTARVILWPQGVR